MSGVSVVLIVQDEERDLPRAVRSSAWADEIVVVDGGSRDRTVAVASNLGCRVVSRPFTDFADQKNYAVSQAAHPWVFSLDADEVISEALAREIRAAVSGPHAAYRVRRVSVMFGRKMAFSGTQSDRPVRLFRKDRARFVQPVHEYVSVTGSVGRLDGTLQHLPYSSVSDYLVKLNRYTSMEAERFASIGRRSGALARWAEPCAMWLRRYAVQQGFRDGLSGFLFSGFSAYYSFLKHAKLWERSR